MGDDVSMKKKILASALMSIALVATLPHAEAATKSCATTQAIEEGPYYLSSTPVRSDVTDGQQGKKMSYSFTILDSTCKPIKGARIDIWFANAQGIYSGVASQGDDLGAGVNSGNFLRGTQTTNAKGVATFTGIYPGWYPARTIHIHEKIWVGGKEVLTTQTFFTDKQNAAVMATAPYNTRGTQRVTNATDMVLNRGGINLAASLMKVSGSKASATIVVTP
jgi:protocatechuate 3,4-dioxygenase beta subunit